jgi:hypothetical protein
VNQALREANANRKQFLGCAALADAGLAAGQVQRRFHRPEQPRGPLVLTEGGRRPGQQGHMRPANLGVAVLPCDAQHFGRVRDAAANLAAVQLG